MLICGMDSERETKESWISDISAWGLNSRGVELFVDKFPSDAKEFAAIDVETDEADNFVGIGVCFEPSRVYYFTKIGPDLHYLLCNTKLMGHNIKSDALWLRKWQIGILAEQLVFDTMLASYVQDSTKSSHALKDLAKEILGYEYPTYKEIVGTGKNKKTLEKQEVSLVANYCGMDTLSTYRLWTYFEKTLSTDQKGYLKDLEIPTMWALMEMEERGVMVDADYLRTLDYKFNVEIQRLAEKIKLRAPSIENINSNQQVGSFLVSKGFALPQTATGKPSVSAKALESFEGCPFIKTLRRHSELDKLIGTYTKPLLGRSNDKANYRLHANFNQAITHTGRLSSSSPNLQNIPTRTDTGNLLRGAFVASPKHIFIDADYSQIEPRLFAHFSQDTELLRIFREGHDLYDYVASAIGSSRSVAKTVWLALSYNAGAFKIAQTAHITSAQAVMFIEKMKERFKIAFKWKEQIIRESDSHKYVETLFGRRIKLKESSLGPNYKVQGSAAEVMKKAIIATQRFQPVLTVHDELLFELYDGAGSDYQACVCEIRQRMENVIKLSIPLVVEIGIGKTWKGAKDD